MSKVHQTITDMLIERVEERRAKGENVVPPWRKTWDPSLGMPRNLLTGHAYRGCNVFMTLLQGYGSPFWLTIKQARKLGGAIRQGERYTPIVFWKFPTEEERERGRFPFCKFYKVWNIEQVDGIEGAVATALAGMGGEPFDPIEAGEAIVQGYTGGPDIIHGGHRACYRVNEDRVDMPAREAFESPEEYYRVLFHELAHSTGHRNRLDRDAVANPVRFASHGYCEEELVAEMAAAMLAGHAGIANEEADENTAAYLDHWLAKLRANPKWLISAGGAAQKAADHIRGIKYEKAES